MKLRLMVIVLALVIAAGVAAVLSIAVDALIIGSSAVAPSYAASWLGH